MRRSRFSKLSVAGIIVLIVFAVPAYMTVPSDRQAESTLRFVSVLHRHGDRNPVFTYPTDPYRNVKRYFPEGLGELINKGKLHLYILGKFLRERYDGFIPLTYRPSQVYIRTVELNRCIMSAQCLMAGLFPPVGAQVWDEHLDWQPAVVHPIPSSIDDMLVVSKPCEALTREREYVQSHLIQNTLDAHKELIDYLSQHTGMDMNNATAIDDLYDTLVVNEEQGLELPEWTRGVYPDKLRPFFFLDETEDTLTPKLKRLIDGVLINDIVSSMMQKRSTKGGWERRVNMYSAQDTTIMRLWRSMGIRQELPKPNYGASLIIELHEIHGHWRVKLLYKNYALDTALFVVNIKGCEVDEEMHKDSSCDLDVFAQVLESVTVSDFDEECKMYCRSFSAPTCH